MNFFQAPPLLLGPWISLLNGVRRRLDLAQLPLHPLHTVAPPGGVRWKNRAGGFPRPASPAAREWVRRVSGIGSRRLWRLPVGVCGVLARQEVVLCAGRFRCWMLLPRSDAAGAAARRRLGARAVAALPLSVLWRGSSEGWQGAWEAVDLVLLDQVRLLLASGGVVVRLDRQCGGSSGGLSGEAEAAAQEPWPRPAAGRGGGHGGHQWRQEARHPCPLIGCSGGELVGYLPVNRCCYACSCW
jgi:hypothetical protein